MSDNIHYVYSYPLLWISMWIPCVYGKDHASLSVHAGSVPVCCVSIVVQWLKCTTFISWHGRGLAHTHCPYHASYILLASCWLSARESVANRGRAGALWGIALSSTYAICPYSPQYLQCMALYLVGCNAGYAANGSVLEGIVGIHGAILAGNTNWRVAQWTM